MVERLQERGSGRLADEGDAAVMEGGAGVDDGELDIGRRHQHIGRGMTVEHEAAVAIGGVGDESQGGARFTREGQAGDVHSFGGQHVSQVAAKRIIADLTHKSGGIAQAGESGGDIGRGATGRFDESRSIADRHAHLQRHKVD